MGFRWVVVSTCMFVQFVPNGYLCPLRKNDHESFRYYSFIVLLRVHFQVLLNSWRLIAEARHFHRQKRMHDY